jgi:hypothetical protein
MGLKHNYGVACANPIAETERGFGACSTGWMAFALLF